MVAKTLLGSSGWFIPIWVIDKYARNINDMLCTTIQYNNALSLKFKIYVEIYIKFNNSSFFLNQEKESLGTYN